MAVRVPNVRHFIACAGVVRSADGQRFTLRNLFHTLTPPSKASYPLALPEMHLFAHLTDGHGRCNFRIECVTWDQQGEESSLWTSPTVIIDMGNDPLRVQGQDFKLRARFPEAGLYEFRLLCEGEILAREPIRLLEVP